MASQALSMAGLTISPANLGSFTSTSRIESTRQSDHRPRALPVTVRASLPVHSSENPARSAFGRGAVSSHSPRLGVRAQASKQTFSSFDDMLKNCDIPVLVDFYAVWCGPCQMMVPILNEVSQVLKDRVRVVKIDTEKYPELASRFGVQALPTLVLFKNGQVADRVEGALRTQELVMWLQNSL